MPKYLTQKVRGGSRRYIIRLDVAKEKNLNGILIQQDVANRQLPQRGTIVGRGKQNWDMSSGAVIPWGYDIGERVLCTRCGGDPIVQHEAVDGVIKEYNVVVINEEDIICIYDDVEIEY